MNETAFSAESPCLACSQVGIIEIDYCRHFGDGVVIDREFVISHMIDALYYLIIIEHK